MKLKRRLLSCLLLGCMIFSLAACGQTSADTAVSDEDQTT